MVICSLSASSDCPWCLGQPLLLISGRFAVITKMLLLMVGMRFGLHAEWPDHPMLWARLPWVGRRVCRGLHDQGPFFEICRTLMGHGRHCFLRGQTQSTSSRYNTVLHGVHSASIGRPGLAGGCCPVSDGLSAWLQRTLGLHLHITHLFVLHATLRSLVCR